VIRDILGLTTETWSAWR